MLYYLSKILISSVLIVLITEIAKKSSFFASLIASLPITSILAFIWLYIDNQNINQIAKLSTDIFYLVIPSLVLFISLPIFLKFGLNFYLSLFISCMLTALSYFLFSYILSYFNIIN